MGLLDNIGENQLLNIGLGILANNTGNYGAFGPAVGKGGLQGIQAMQQAQLLALQKKLSELQMQRQAMEMKKETREEQEYERKLKARQGLLDTMQGTEQFAGPYADPNMAVQRQVDPVAVNKALMDYDPDSVVKSLMKGPEYQTLNEGESLYSGGKEIAKNPKQTPRYSNIKQDEVSGKTYGFDATTNQWAEIPGAVMSPKSAETKNTQLEQLLDAAGVTDPKQRAKFIMQGINKEVSFAPSMMIQNFPSPTPSIGPDGKPALIQFGNKGEARPTGYAPYAPASERRISTIDAKSIDRSLEKASGANAGIQLLDQADALYEKYDTDVAEPILGGMSRAAAAIGLGDKTRAADYETAGSIAKDLGIIKLGLIGGSDTERELITAIDTSPSPDKLPATNRAIIANQRRAIEILQSEPDFKTEWVNKHGSLSSVDKETGETYGKAWRKFQKDNFRPVTIPNEKTSKTPKPTIDLDLAAKAREELARRNKGKKK